MHNRASILSDPPEVAARGRVPAHFTGEVTVRIRREVLAEPLRNYYNDTMIKSCQVSGTPSFR